MIQMTPAVLRQLQFLANYEAIKAHNAEFIAGRKEFSLSLNQFADMVIKAAFLLQKKLSIAIKLTFS